jgi:hypothetical protein
MGQLSVIRVTDGNAQAQEQAPPVPVDPGRRANSGSLTIRLQFLIGNGSASYRLGVGRWKRDRTAPPMGTMWKHFEALVITAMLLAYGLLAWWGP